MKQQAVKVGLKDLGVWGALLAPEGEENILPGAASLRRDEEACAVEDGAISMEGPEAWDMEGSSWLGTGEEDTLAVALVACLGNRPIAAVAAGSRVVDSDVGVAQDIAVVDTADDGEDGRIEHLAARAQRTWASPAGFHSSR